MANGGRGRAAMPTQVPGAAGGVGASGPLGASGVLGPSGVSVAGVSALGASGVPGASGALGALPQAAATRAIAAIRHSFFTGILLVVESAEASVAVGYHRSLLAREPSRPGLYSGLPWRRLAPRREQAASGPAAGGPAAGVESAQARTQRAASVPLGCAWPRCAAGSRPPPSGLTARRASRRSPSARGPEARGRAKTWPVARRSVQHATAARGLVGTDFP